MGEAGDRDGGRCSYDRLTLFSCHAAGTLTTGSRATRVSPFLSLGCHGISFQRPYWPFHGIPLTFGCEPWDKQGANDS